MMDDRRIDGRIGFIGGGRMAEALAGGLIAAGLDAENVVASDPEPARRRELAERIGVTTTHDNADAVRGSDAVVIAVKPGLVTDVLSDLVARRDLDCGGPLWISIAAGVRLARLEAPLPAGARIVRAMPNTPALVRSGATAICGNHAAQPADLALARALFDSVGVTWQAAEESQLDAVTALSGSGPAYVFALLEALIEAATREGLPRDAAETLALHTALGAAKLAIESGQGPAALREQVSSPGGTTLAGLAALSERGFAEALAAAVSAAAARSRELGAD